MKTIRTFLLGVWEFRSQVTTNFPATEIETYDAGRELAHKLTLRHFEN